MKRIFLLFILFVYVSLKAIEIEYPQDLANQFNSIGEIRYNLARFGEVKYPSLNGRLYYFPKNLKGCRKFKKIDTSMLADDEVPVFLVNRGACTFVTKTRHAQRAGAQLVILKDNIVEQLHRIILIDDSTGGDITIPLIMIRKNDENHVEMEPYYETEKCKYCDRTFKMQNCLANGQFCMMPQGEGKQILIEEIRQICIYNYITGSNKEYKDLRWWDYITNLRRNKCSLTDVDCLQLAAGTAGIDWKQVEKCVNQSFKEKKFDSYTDNLILEKQFEFWDTHMKHQAPAITIQDKYFSGGLDPKEVFKQICRNFTEPPKACQ